jgi:hypothetical protein
MTLAAFHLVDSLNPLLSIEGELHPLLCIDDKLHPLLCDLLHPLL